MVRKTIQNPIAFSIVFEHPLMPMKANTRHETHSKIIEKHIIPNQRFVDRRDAHFQPIFENYFQVRDLNVSRRVLGSILASISDHAGLQNDV